MKKYAVVSLLATMLVALSAGSASAAPGQSFHIKLKGASAEALWESTTATSFTDTDVLAELNSPGGPSLFFDQFTGFDDGSSVEMFGTATDASIAVSTKLTSASGVATVPVTVCTFDANGNGGCVDGGSVAVNAQWTGAGPLQHGVFNDHVTSKGSKFHDHFNGYRRDASATATIGSQSLNASTLLFAELFISKEGISSLCHNC
jgi:hypothetical protein